VEFKKHIDIILDNLRIGVMNPLLPTHSGSGTGWAAGMVYEQLIKRVGEGQFEPWLATSWETNDGQTITMKLRNDVTFHNGEKFTSADVVYTINTAQSLPGTLLNNQFSPVDTVTAIDEYTVEFVLKSVNLDFFDGISTPFAPILNEKAINDDPEKGPWVGTGAYYISGFATNEYVEVARNDNYWGEKGITETIRFSYIPEESTRLMMIQNDEADFTLGTNTNDIPILEADTEHFNTIRIDLNGIGFLGFNMNDPITGDLNFRKAVVSALKKEDITIVTRGRYARQETSGTFWGPAVNYRNNNIPMIPYDLEKAKEYLAASVYNGEVIEMSTGTLTQAKSLEVVQQNLALIGIKTTINQLDTTSYALHTSYADNKSQIFCSAGMFTSAPFAMRSWFYPGGAGNKASYNNPEVTRLFDLGPTLTDQEERRKVYYEIQELVAADLPYTIIYNHNVGYTAQLGVDGITFSMDNYHDFRYMYRIIG